ncbi:hypothetical protein [uncultured Methylobacterium sp.]|uniref:hypothetical protein n=1 Tax=uncultured Methylobacterium sp. TaxID=157278 RepID=UPI0035CA4AE8
MIRYAYLCQREHRRGQEEGSKDRPCAVLLTVTDDAGDRIVVALPITHAPPDEAGHGIELPAATKRRLGLDDAQSWVIVTEANRFVWPGPDLRRASRDDPASVVYGELPRALFEQVRQRWLALYVTRQTGLVPRTE